VLVNLGNASPDPIVFGVSDCGCSDNSGELTFTVDVDADNDGVFDSAEFPVCPNTLAGSTVNSLGCLLEQICPCSEPLARERWNDRREYVGCVEQATKEFVTLGLMMNNRGIPLLAPLARMTAGNWRRLKRASFSSLHACKPDAGRVCPVSSDRWRFPPVARFPAVGVQVRQR
jgi:hypothetical protein